MLEDAWYILPADEVLGKETVCLCSSSKLAKYEKYREAWHLLREAAEAGENAENGADSGDAKPGAGYPLHESTASGPAGRAFPRNALERMEAVESYVRRSLEGGPFRPQPLHPQKRTGRINS